MLNKRLLLLVGLASAAAGACGFPNPAAPALCGFGDAASATAPTGNSNVCSAVVSTSTAADTAGKQAPGELPGANLPTQ
jgi:hypothetical protein